MIGLLSSVIDNVPLVAGAMNMYPLATDASIAQAAQAGVADMARLKAFRQNGLFWEFLAYCAGTGGSCLIIGSAAGGRDGHGKNPIHVVSQKSLGFALSGYLAGAAVYVAIECLSAKRLYLDK